MSSFVLVNIPFLFKNIHQIEPFTDHVVELCLADSKRTPVLLSWVLRLLQEWLILKLKVGHGINALIWWNEILYEQRYPLIIAHMALCNTLFHMGQIVKGPIQFNSI